MTSQAWGIKKDIEKLCMRLRGLHGGDASLWSADPADVVGPHMTETLYEPRRPPLDLLQTVGVGNKVRRAGLHSVLKMRPNQRVIKGSKRGRKKGLGSSSKHFIRGYEVSTEATPA